MQSHGKRGLFTALIAGAAALATPLPAAESLQIPVDDMDNWFCEYFAGAAGGEVEGPRRGRGWAGAMAFDAYGNAFVAAGSMVLAYTSDDQAHRVAGIEISGSVDGPGTLACLASVGAIACHPTNGTLYVSDLGNQVIKKLTRTSDGSWLVTTVAGQHGKSGHQDGPGREALLQRVDGIALDSRENLYLMDQDWLRRLSPDGQLVTLNPKGGSGAFGPGLEHDLESARFNRIMGAGQLACDENDNLLLADKWNGTFERVDFRAGKVTILAGGPARGSPGFRDSNTVTDGPGNSVAVFFAGGGPGGLAYDRLTRRIYTTTADEHAIRAIMPDGMVKTLGPWFKGINPAVVQGPARQTRGAAWIAGVDFQGRVYAGTRAGRIYRFYRNPAIEGAPPPKTPNPLLPWPAAARAPGAAEPLKLAFDAPPPAASNALQASAPVECAAPREAVAEFAAEVAIGSARTQVVFAPRKARLGATSLSVDAVITEKDGTPERCVRAEFRRDADAATGKAEALELALPGANPVVASDGRQYVVAYDDGNAVRVVRLDANGQVVDAKPIPMGERWHQRPALAWNGQTFAVVATRQPRHNPWGWGGPPMFSLGRFTADGKTPDNIRLKDDQITEGGYASVVDHVQWKGRKGWPAGTKGGFKDTENGYWPGLYSSLAWDGKSWVVAWVRYRVRDSGDADLFACRVDPETLMATSDPVLVAGGAAEPGAQTQPALVGIGNGASLLVYQAVPADGRARLLARLLTGGSITGPARLEPK
jgi:DNA-binding beta-propeller fold protein YncE